MRHTLIPITLRKSLRHEYRIRAFIVFLFMISTAFIIGAVLLLPSFIHAALDKSAAYAELAPLKAAAEKSGKSNSKSDLLKKANIIKILASSPKGKTEYSSIVKGILDARGKSTITSISVARTSPTTVVTTIVGMSPNREELLALKNKLILGKLGNKVDVPVSLLAKSKNISFSLSVTNDQTP
ncbi:MAG: hypothetical protein WCP09_00340 [Candidatus Taylorbacteria bacterium]